MLSELVTDSTQAVSFHTTSELLRQNPRPDALICANNSIALGAMNAIRDSGLTLPGQIALITFDDYPFSRITNPMMSVVNIDINDMGKQAALLLIKKIKQPALSIQTYTTLPILIVRGSTVDP